MLGEKQWQVSRWAKQVAVWIAAGNVFPDLPAMTAKPTALDPDVMDMGERQDALTKRQRRRRSDDDERD